MKFIDLVYRQIIKSKRFQMFGLTQIDDRLIIKHVVLNTLNLNT
jgi:hypothetical protein